ncbi:hypothetical protein RB195_016233 [Necator americanus]|uniref:Uncharacterized protein n=1 Tax=Necator americanus TaxID=51031 RepID=A0ABR1E8A8_NECAM
MKRRSDEREVGASVCAARFTLSQSAGRPASQPAVDGCACSTGSLDVDCGANWAIADRRDNTEGEKRHSGLTRADPPRQC